MSELKDLKDMIEKHLAIYPDHASSILSSVSNGLVMFKQAVEKQRSSEGQIALKSLMALVMDRKIKDKDKAVLMAHGMPFHFPEGFKESYAQVEKQFLMMFCKLYFKDPYLHGSDWEKDHTSGYLYFANLKSQYDKIELDHKTRIESLFEKEK